MATKKQYTFRFSKEEIKRIDKIKEKMPYKLSRADIITAAIKRVENYIQNKRVVDIFSTVKEDECILNTKEPPNEHTH